MSKIRDIYKNIALDYIKTNNIVDSYKKYHPNVSEASLAVLPYNLLENVRFKQVKEEVAREIEPDLEKNVQECLNVLKSLSETAIKQSDRILASTNYLKFTMGEKSRTIMTEDRKAELDSIAKRLGITN